MRGAGTQESPRTRRAASTKRWLVAASVCLALVATPTLSRDAHADGRAWVGASAANLNTLGDGGLWGVGGQFGTQLMLSDFWGIFGDLGGSYHFENEDDELPADVVTAVSAGLRYNLDVFTYVPYVGLAATAYLDTPLVDQESPNTNAGAKFLIGVDWRYDRFWSLGFQAEIHALFTDLNRYPVYSTLGVNLGYHFRL